MGAVRANMAARDYSESRRNEHQPDIEKDCPITRTCFPMTRLRRALRARRDSRKNTKDNDDGEERALENSLMNLNEGGQDVDDRNSGIIGVDRGGRLQLFQ